MAILLFCTLFFTLFFLSRSLTRLLSRLLMQLSHSTPITIHVLSFLFLPGVVLHELSHLLMASILFVPTGEVEFFPEIHGSEVKMGSVAIAKTDPLRRFLIGIAPIMGGLGIMILASFYLSSSLISWQSGILLYIIFEISNTMFSSGKDMEGALGFGIAIVSLAVILQLIHIPLAVYLIGFLKNQVVLSFFFNINIFLIIALGINVFLVLLLEGIARMRV